MGKLKALINEAETQFKSENSNRRSLNLPVKFDRLEGEILHGEVVGSGDQVKISLNNSYQKKSNSEYDRPTLSSLANNGKKSVVAGGVIQFENAYQTEDGTWVARWPRVVAKNETGNTKVAVAKTKIYVGSASSGMKFIEAKMFWPEKAKTIKSLEELTAYLEQRLVPSSIGVVNTVMIKLKDGEDVFCAEARAQLIEVESAFSSTGKGKVVNPNSKESVNAFLESKYGMIVKNCFEDGGIDEITVCNGCTMYVGKDTKDNMMKKTHAINFLKNEFLIDKEAQYTRESIGYKDVVIGVRTDDEQKYITHILSLDSFEEPIKEEDLF